LFQTIIVSGFAKSDETQVKNFVSSLIERGKVFLSNLHSKFSFDDRDSERILCLLSSYMILQMHLYF